MSLRAVSVVQRPAAPETAVSASAAGAPTVGWVSYRVVVLVRGRTGAARRPAAVHRRRRARSQWRRHPACSLGSFPPSRGNTEFGAEPSLTAVLDACLLFFVWEERSSSRITTPPLFSLSTGCFPEVEIFAVLLLGGGGGCR